MLVNAQHSTIWIYLDDSCADMLVGGSKPRIARAHPIFRTSVGRLQTASRRTLMEAVDRSDDVALFVLNGRNMHDGPDMGTVRPLKPAFDAADRNPGSKNFRHRRLFTRNKTTIEVELVRSAIEFTVVADAGFPSPEFGCSRVEPKDAPGCIAGVHRDRELFEKLGRRAAPPTQSERFETAKVRRGPFLHVHCVILASASNPKPSARMRTGIIIEIVRAMPIPRTPGRCGVLLSRRRDERFQLG